MNRRRSVAGAARGPDYDLARMREALRLARRGEGRVSPNPMVGAVVVDRDGVAGCGFHAVYGGPHAEIVALEQAGARTRGSTVYVTLEPCCHFGKTPPCTRALIEAGVARVVVAMVDPNPLVHCSGLSELRAAGIEVEVGLCGGEARALNEAFVRHITTGLPLVTVKSAISLDGRIATGSGDSGQGRGGISGPEANRRLHRLRHAVDGIAIGVSTLLADDPLLTTRLPGRGWRSPARFILDTRLRSLPEAGRLRLFATAFGIPTHLVCARPEATAAAGREAGRYGVRLLPVRAARDGGVDIADFLHRAGRLGIASLLVEGGGRVNGAFLAGGHVDRVIGVITPLLIGDGGVAWFSGLSTPDIEQAVHLEQVSVRRAGRDWIYSAVPARRV